MKNTHALLVTTWIRTLGIDSVGVSSTVIYFDNQTEQLEAAQKIRSESTEAQANCEVAYEHKVIVL